MAGIATWFLLNWLHRLIGSIGEVVDGELLFGVMDPGLVHDRRDPAREYSGRYVACVGFRLYEFWTIRIELVNVLFLAALIADLVRRPECAMILSRDTPTFSRLGSSRTDESFMVAFCSNAVGLRRCAGSKRDEAESLPCDGIDCILDARHPVNAIIGNTYNILIESESPFKLRVSIQNAFYHTLGSGSDLFFFLPSRGRFILIATFVEDTDRRGI
jgi:hypothetical protein